MVNLIDLVEPLIAIAKQASDGILDIYQHAHSYEIKTKQDHSPVTQADLLAHDIIYNGLRQLTPAVPVLSEEGILAPFGQRQSWSHYWSVDPLDGTHEFIRRSGEFTINIALIHQHKPILGILYVPVLDDCYYACQHHGAYKRNANHLTHKIMVANWQPNSTIVYVSHGVKEELLYEHIGYLGAYKLLKIGSAWKFGLIAEGKGDLYPRQGETYEWDTAASQCILEEAGGALLDWHGQPLRYNTQESLLNSSFVALGDKSALMPQLQQFFAENNG